MDLALILGSLAQQRIVQQDPTAWKLKLEPLRLEIRRSFLPARVINDGNSSFEVEPPSPVIFKYGAGLFPKNICSRDYLRDDLWPGLRRTSDEMIAPVPWGLGVYSFMKQGFFEQWAF